VKRACERCQRARELDSLARKCPCGGRLVPVEDPGDELPVAHRATSIGGAIQAAKALPRMRRRVLELIVGAGENGLSDEEATALLGAGPNSARPRRVELEALGLVRDSGQRKETRAGVEAIRWVATNEGRYLVSPPTTNGVPGELFKFD
jgi:hypothetical protein